jgi:hypothetical protein
MSTVPRGEDQTKNSDAPGTWSAADMRKEDVSNTPLPRTKGGELCAVLHRHHKNMTINLHHSHYQYPLTSPSGSFRADSHIACRAHAAPMLFPCRAVNSHMPCRAPAMLRQCRPLRESPRGSRKYPNC